MAGERSSYSGSSGTVSTLMKMTFSMSTRLRAVVPMALPIIALWAEVLLLLFCFTIIDGKNKSSNKSLVKFAVAN